MALVGVQHNTGYFLHRLPDTVPVRFRKFITLGGLIFAVLLVTEGIAGNKGQ
jgi:hypothetical protein